MPKLKTLFFLVALTTTYYLLPTIVYAAPCYGTDLPQKSKFLAYLESYTLFNRDLENDLGQVRSQQEFFGISYGIFDWLSVDLKAGAGNIRQSPEGGGSARYSASFAGGYGLRFKFLDRDKFKAVFGFQHISVHPHSTQVDGVKNKAILDDWQTSLLVSRQFGKFTPYLGTRWSRVDYIHWVDEDRKRIMSDDARSYGLIVGCSVPVMEKISLNLEGQFLDSEALAFRVDYIF